MASKAVRAFSRVVSRVPRGVAAGRSVTQLQRVGLMNSRRAVAVPSLQQWTSAMQTREMSYFSDDEELEGIVYPSPTAKIGETAPTFTAKAVVDGEITEVSLEDYEGKWVVLFWYPKDFTFVCPTEIIAFSDRANEFRKIGAEVLAISTDSEESHLAWTRLPRNQGGLGKMDIPLVADLTKMISAQYGVLQEDIGIAFRGLFIINPEGVLEQITMNNFPVGRSVDETLRLVQAFQFVAEHGEVCPANWTPGDKTIIPNPEDSQAYFSTVEDNANAESDKIYSVKSADEIDALISSGKPTVVDFMANWCGKCQQIAPYYEKLAEKNPDVKFVKVDTAAAGLESSKEKHGIQSLPTFKFYKNGEEVGAPVVGYKKRPLAQGVKELSK